MTSTLNVGGHKVLVDIADLGLIKGLRLYVYMDRGGRRVSVHVRGNGLRTGYLHRLIMGAPGVDHIDGNRLNNSRSNLRIATAQQNCRNRSKFAGGTSKFKGVHWSKSKKKWRGKITDGYKSIHLGYFADEVACASAYDVAAQRIHGEFARLNFSPSTTQAGAVAGRRIGDNPKETQTWKV